MSNDSMAGRVRMRAWIEKVDHTEDPPRVVERVFVEDGQVVRREVLPVPEAKEKQP